MNIINITVWYIYIYIKIETNCIKIPNIFSNSTRIFSEWFACINMKREIAILLFVYSQIKYAKSLINYEWYNSWITANTYIMLSNTFMDKWLVIYLAEFLICMQSEVRRTQRWAFLLTITHGIYTYAQGKVHNGYRAVIFIRENPCSKSWKCRNIQITNTVCTDTQSVVSDDVGDDTRLSINQNLHKTILNWCQCCVPWWLTIIIH